MTGRNRPLAILSWAVYLLLYAPIAILILFSFNDSRRSFVWRGFTLRWYPELFGDREVLGALRIGP